MNKALRIKILLAIDSFFFLLELITGYAVHSLALIADSFHMFNDILSLVVALWAVRVAKKRSSGSFTYGFQRAEILGALVNGVFLLALCVTICLEAIQRFVEVPEVQNPKLILFVGFWGLVSNIAGLFLFHEHGHSHGGGGHSHGAGDDEESHSHSHGHSNSPTANILLPEDVVQREEDRLLSAHQQYGSISHAEHCHSRPKDSDPKSKRSMNMEGVWLHVLGDALGNVGVMLTALFIWKTDYWWRFYADPFISLVITCIIFNSALPLCKRAGRVLLQATPSSIDAREVYQDIASLPGVADIHDLHIWQLNEELTVATLHVSISDSPTRFPAIAKEIQRCFAGWNVHSITIQPEFQQSDSHGLHQCESFGNLPTGGLNAPMSPT